ncbi:outer membrane protein [Shewanella waksmanii]|uniref:outer membrane protein n=1 Tax=Shewanella waksmanii TaxID=213783 RepID=UPI00048CDF44|nr:outer membrane beta-barrel protein [Shewanella waksmanii]
MKKSAIAIAALLALSTGAANADVMNGFTGKIEAEYTTQDKHANVEAQLGYDFNLGAVSVVPFLSAETGYSGEKDVITDKAEGFDRGAIGGGLRVETNFDNFYAYAEGRAMVKDHIKVQGPVAVPMKSNSNTLLEGTLNEYRVEIGSGYQFDSGFSAGVEAAFTREDTKLKGINSIKDDKREVFAVAGYNFNDNFSLYAKVGAADTAELNSLAKSKKDDGKWETKTVVGVTYKF